MLEVGRYKNLKIHEKECRRRNSFYDEMKKSVSAEENPNFPY